MSDKLISSLCGLFLGEKTVMSVIEKWIKEVYSECGSNGRIDDILDEILCGNTILKSPMLIFPMEDILSKLLPPLIEAKGSYNKMTWLADNYPLKEHLEILDKYDTAMSKNECMASLFRLRSYRYFRLGEFDMALRCAHFTFLFAPTDIGSEYIGRAHVDRASFLFTLKKFDSFTTDVRFALSHDLLPRLLPKVREMNHRYLELQKIDLGRAVQTHSWNKYCDQVLFKISGLWIHPKIPSAANYLQIRNVGGKGRAIFTTRNLKAGTTVIVENPFATVQSRQLKWDLKNCTTCLKATDCLFPCPKCVYVVYCSIACLKKDLKDGHQYACGCYNYLHAMNATTSLHLAFKLVCKAGPNVLYKLYIDSGRKMKHPGETLKSHPGTCDISKCTQEDCISCMAVKSALEDDDEGENTTDHYKNSKIPPEARIKGMNPKTGVYGSDYFQVFNLVSYIIPGTLEVMTYTGFTLAKVLEHKSNFFDGIDGAEKKGFISFVASALVYHQAAVPMNGLTLWEDGERMGSPSESSSQGDEVNDPSCHVGIYPLCSLLCHSCNPTCFRVNLKNGKLAIVTTRNVKRGEEITISYGFEYWTYKLEDRIRLCSNFYFKCDCIACVNQWPLELSPMDDLRLLCPKCSNNYSYEEHTQNERCVLKFKYFLGTCDNCKSSFIKSLCYDPLEKYALMSTTAENHVLNRKPSVAIPMLLQCLEFYQRAVVSPTAQAVQIKSLLMKAYELVTSRHE